MRIPPHLSVVIPAYNEQDRLGPTLRRTAEYFRARRQPIELIVVDDGSHDRTSEVANRHADEFDEIRLIRLAANRGKGYAVRSGVVNARGRAVLFADADGATPIEEFERLESALTRGAAIAIGSRALPGTGVRVTAKLYRRLMGRAFHQLVRWLTVRGIQDTQCGFKLFRAEVAHDLFSRMRMNGFSFDVELLMMAQRCGYRIEEVPVNWVHQPGSRVNLVVDSLRMAADLFVIRGHAIRGDYNRPHVTPMPLALESIVPDRALSLAVHADGRSSTLGAGDGRSPSVPPLEEGDRRPTPPV